MKKEKDTNDLNILIYIKLSLFISICIECILLGRSKKNINNNPNNLINSLITTNYNMIRFLDHENLEFNSMAPFFYFRKKYFNVSHVKLYYNETDATTIIEYIVGFYDENKTLMKKFHESNKYKINCFKKTGKHFTYSPPIIIKNNYYQCFEVFINNETNTFGMQLKNKKMYINFYLNFDEILAPLKNNTSNTF